MISTGISELISTNAPNCIYVLHRKRCGDCWYSAANDAILILPVITPLVVPERCEFASNVMYVLIPKE